MSLDYRLKRSIACFTLIALGVVSYIAITINPHSFSWLIATLINLLLAGFIYLRDRKNRLNSIFALMSLCLGIWTFHVFGLYIVPTEALATSWSKVFRIGMLFLPPTFFHFTLALTGNKEKGKIKLLYVAYALALISTILHWMGLLTSEYIKVAWKYSPKPGILYRLWLLNLAFWLFYGLLHVFRTYQTSKSARERNQLRYFFVGAAIAVVFSFANALLSFGIKVYPVGGFTTIFYTGMVAYAIVKHQLMDIRIVIKRSVVYASLTAAIAGGYFLTLSVFALIFQNMAGHDVLATIVFALIVVFGFQPLRDRIQKITDKLFFKDKYDYQKTLRKFSRELSSIIELDRLSMLIVDMVTRTMYINKSSLLLRDEKRKEFHITRAKGLEKEKIKNIRFSFDNQFIRTLFNNRRILNREEIEVRLNEDSRLRENEKKKKEFKAIDKEMNQLEAMLSIPLVTKNRLIGIFNLGAKKSEDVFTGEDIELLYTIANQAATAIENAQLYAERSEMEKALHQRDKMAALGTLASSIAHEIKNPLTPIKTFIQLLPRKFDDANFRDKFNAVVPQEIERLDNVLQGLTDFSRPAEGREYAVDVQKAIEEILLLMKAELSKYRVKVIKKYENVPQIAADGEQLKQVFMNLILNAAQAMPGGGTLTIATKVIGDRLKVMGKDLKPDSQYPIPEGNFIEISFTDTGSGIPPEDLPRLFDAFFTTKEKGTGLGLAISQRIIKDHNGTIEVKSEPGKGSTLIIHLPPSQGNSILSPLTRQV